MGISLKDQLRRLEEDAPKSLDPEAAYSSLDSNERPQREAGEGREHYVDVGPSRLRAAAGGDETAQTLLTEKYGGQASSRMKIFDDDDEEDEEEEEQGAFGGDDDEDDDREEDEDEEDFDEDDDEEEDDEDEEDEEDEEEDEDEDEDTRPAPSGRALDPVGALRESRRKDIEKGRGIKRQRDLFDTLLTLRITFQKALPASFKVPGDAADIADPEGEVATKRAETLASLASLNEKLFALREAITLPGTEAPAIKRRRTSDEADEEGYWAESAADSFALVDAAHPQLVPVLNKWSTKIHAASLQLGKAGGSKFAQATKGAVGVVEAIDASLAQRRDAPKPLLESEEAGYRALLREVIESRQGAGVDLSHLRREKKKKREAERGGSKGRKLRYTVHEKAANFLVPVPLENGWHEEQVDELFSSLFGGVGLAGALSAVAPEAGPGAVGAGLVELGGLKVF